MTNEKCYPQTFISLLKLLILINFYFMINCYVIQVREVFSLQNYEYVESDITNS